MFQVDIQQAGAAVQPSPSIWDDCPGQTLNDQGTGFYFHEDFITGTENFIDKGPVGGASLTINASAGSTIPHRTGGSPTVGFGLQDVSVTNTSGFASALYTQSIGTLVPNSGNKLWFEVRLTLRSLAAAQGLFVGLAAEAILTKDIVANGAASVAAGLAADSLVGFTVQADNQSKVYAVISKDAGAPVIMASDVTNSAALGSGAASLVATTYVKLGFKFDGRKTIRIYVNGTQVATYTVTTSSINVADNLGAIIGQKTAAAAALTNTYDWIRVAVRSRR
jgi:hypothetical protein